MGVKKSTRKFEKKKLPKVLEKRKVATKAKQVHALNEKRKKKRRLDRGGENTNGSAEKEKDQGKSRSKVNGDEVGISAFEGMSMDDFLAQGFEVPELAGRKKGNKGKGAEENKTGKKRKRTLEQDWGGEESGGGEEEEEEWGGIDDASDTGDDDIEAEFKEYKAQVVGLAEKDPEFYKYLQENDAELLEFNDELPGVDGLSESDDDDSEAEGTKKKMKQKMATKDSAEGSGEGKKTSGEEVTKAHVERWKKMLTEEKSLRALKKVVLAFRAAVHVNDEKDDSHTFKYTITNPDVYNDLMLLGLQQIPIMFSQLLPVKESASGPIHFPTNKKLTGLTLITKTHFSSLLTLLPKLSDPSTLKLLLTSCTSLLPYLLTFRKQLKLLLKSVVDIWSTFSTSSSATAANDDSVRITAFLVIRRAMVLGDAGIKETCLKALYAGFVLASRDTNVHTLGAINLMKNSCGETLGLQGMEKVGYVVGFGSIRQLAIHLRSSTTNKTKDSYKTVYNFQYVHSLDFWSRALSNLCSASHLADPSTSPYHPLIYPLVQITLGAARLIPTAQYFPLRFYLIKCLLRISSSTGTYIPLSPLIFEVLSSVALRKKVKGGKGVSAKALDMETTLRCPPTHLKSRTFQTQCSDTSAILLGEFLSIWCLSPAFPELAAPVIVGVKRLIKRNESDNTQAIAPLKVLVGKFEANASLIESERSKWSAEMEASPAKMGDGEVRYVNPKTGFEGFMKGKEEAQMPLGGYVSVQRKIREERRKVLEEAIRAEGEGLRKNKKEEEEEEGRVVGGDEDEDDGSTDKEQEAEEEGEGEGEEEEESVEESEEESEEELEDSD